MTLRRIRLELARCPEFPDGSIEHGYEFVAPLNEAGQIDAEGWRRERKACTVRRFWKGEDDEHGHLIHTRQRTWCFHYDLDSEPGPDEPGYRFDTHVFKEGEYVSITEHDGQTMPFRVTRVSCSESVPTCTLWPSRAFSRTKSRTSAMRSPLSVLHCICPHKRHAARLEVDPFLPGKPFLSAMPRLTDVVEIRPPRSLLRLLQ